MTRTAFMRISVLVIVLIALFATLGVYGQEEPLSEAPQKALPKLNIISTAQLTPVVERVAAQLRAAGIVDASIQSGDSDYIINKLAADPTAADLLLVESREAATVLVRSGLVEAADLRSLASDRLVLALRSDEVTKQPLNVLADIKPGRIVIADPELTLAGVHAKQAMERIGLWQKISFKVRHCDSQQAAARELLDKSADAAVLYLSTVVQTPGIDASMTFPKDSYLSILYLGAPLKGSPRQELARAFLVRLAGPASGPVWMDNGFNPPPAGLP